MLSFYDFINEKQKQSPYKPETLKRYQKKWKKGDEIPFGIEASLKAQGMIPRVDGTIKVSPEYKKTSVITPETDAKDSHADKVEQRIHKEEKERKTPKKDKIITKQQDFHHKKDHKHGSPDDKDLEGNKGKVIDNWKDTSKKKSKQKTIMKSPKKKNYNAKSDKGTTPTWSGKQKKVSLKESKFLFYDEFINEGSSFKLKDLKIKEVKELLSDRPYREDMPLHWFNDETGEMGFGYTGYQPSNPLEMIDNIIRYIKQEAGVIYELPEILRNAKSSQYVIHPTDIYVN